MAKKVTGVKRALTVFKVSLVILVLLVLVLKANKVKGVIRAKEVIPALKVHRAQVVPVGFKVTLEKRVRKVRLVHKASLA